MDSSRIFIVGANGQLGTALRTQYPEARSADISGLDITNRSQSRISIGQILKSSSMRPRMQTLMAQE